VSARDGTEYRVCWKREGLARRTKIYQTREGADRYVVTLQGAYEELMSEEEAAWWGTKRIPALEDGPTVEARVVGAWEPV
jgi:hypothetical protein